MSEQQKEEASSLRPPRASMLLSWWLKRLRVDVVSSLALWTREPEWPLLVLCAILTVSFLFHWLGYVLAAHQIGWPSPLFSPTSWEGRIGWRKPVVFGISNAMVSVTLRQALRAQQLAPRGFVSHLAAWSTAVEVSIITVQAWRDVPSHFNTSTTLDAVLYATKLWGVFLLSIACLLATVGVYLKPSRAAPAQLAALRHGLLLMMLAIVVGFVMVAAGHLPREAYEEEMLPCLEATAGAAASPCYEIRGQAIVKLAHFLPLHATEVLLLLAWAASWTSGKSLFLVRFASWGCWSLAFLGLWTVWVGKSIKRPSAGVAIATALSLTPIVTAFLWVFLLPLQKTLNSRVRQ